MGKQTKQGSGSAKKRIAAGAAPLWLATDPPPPSALLGYLALGYLARTPHTPHPRASSHGVPTHHSVCGVVVVPSALTANRPACTGGLATAAATPPPSSFTRLAAGLAPAGFALAAFAFAAAFPVRSRSCRLSQSGRSITRAGMIKIFPGQKAGRRRCTSVCVCGGGGGGGQICRAGGSREHTRARWLGRQDKLGGGAAASLSLCMGSNFRLGGEAGHAGEGQGEGPGRRLVVIIPFRAAPLRA